MLERGKREKLVFGEHGGSVNGLILEGKMEERILTTDFTDVTDSKRDMKFKKEIGIHLLGEATNFDHSLQIRILCPIRSYSSSFGG